MADTPSEPKKATTKPKEKNPAGLEGAPPLRYSLPSITEPKKPMSAGTKTVLYFLLLLIIGFIAVPLIFYIVTGQNPIDALKNKIAPTPQLPSKSIAQPKVTIEIEKTKDGNILIVRWTNLPAGTAKVKIYRAKAGTTDWVLWKTENVSIGGSATGGTNGVTGNAQSGSTIITLGKKDDGYVYYVQAVADTGSTQNAGSNSTSSVEIVLWESSSTTPEVVTPPPAPPPSPQTPPPSPGTPGPSPTPTPPPTPTPTPTPPPPTPSPSPTPSGIPYYTPQGIISGYGQPQTGNFWVQHTDNKIDIGWQSLPQETTKFIVSRSQNQTGPWIGVLTQTNPPTTGGPYSIKIVDQTLYQNYYYEMDVYNGTTLVTSYGPVLLTALGQ